MKAARVVYAGAVAVAVLVGLGLWEPGRDVAKADRGNRQVAPKFVVDAAWPKALPNNWLVGQVAGIAVDRRDHIWIIQRQSTLTDDERGAALSPPRSDCCFPAPPVIEFDARGNFIQGWGMTNCTPPACQWPANEHGIFVDHNDFVYIAGNGGPDHQVLKFTRSGTFVKQFGRSGMTGGSNDINGNGGLPLLGRPADVEVDPTNNELYIADGYLNKRVIVLDAVTGAYKRHWGAYGNVPSDAPLGPYDPAAPVAQQFRNPVHCVRIAEDGLVYVCDRVNNRIQVFQKNGTFVDEFFVEKDTLGNGSTWDIDLSPDRRQTYLYNPDGENNSVWTLLRATGDILARFGRNGRSAGQFHWVHNLAVDSKGNIYTAEVDTGKRAQKFTFVGLSSGDDGDNHRDKDD